MANCIDYRLALILPHSLQVVVQKVDGSFRLPQIGIPLWGRPAEQLTRLIKDRWHIKSIILDVVASDLPGPPCAVIEVRTSLWVPTIESLLTVDLDRISDESLLPHEREILRRILMGEDCGRGPFSRVGWIDDIQDWVRSVTEGCGVTLTGETLHLSAGGHFCLIRLGTSDGNSYWLKATGEPNTREFGLVTLLTETCPQYLPRLVATHKDWNAWLMMNHGSSLLASESLVDFRRATHAMADLQRMFIGRSDTLFAACCGDRRNQTLRSHVVGLIAYLDEAMALQTSVKAPKLSTSRLKEIGAALERACSTQQELGIPDSLMHSDINPGNILYDGDRYVFTDWCEANIGNPFVTLEQMCMHAVRGGADTELWTRTLRAEYKACWKDLLSDRQMDQAIQLAPLLSILSSLDESFKWLESSRRYDPQVLSYSRSLARHIDQMVQTPDIQEALCQ